jgi:hypothetical protein
MLNPAVRYLLDHLKQLVPDLTDLDPFRDRNLNNWRVTGAYSCSASSTHSFTLNVNPREYAGVIFAEAQHLLNQASEHRAHILNFQNSPNDPSPSWLFVSLYYYSLYIAMAWTRVVNGGIIYLDRDSIRQYCGSFSGNSFAGAGAFKATLNSDDSIGKYQVEMLKCKSSHFHEAVWIAVNNETALAANWTLSLSASRRQTPEEEVTLRAFRLFGGLNFKDALVWPSKLRNAINYRPGFSYRSVVRNNKLAIGSRLRHNPFQDFEALVAFGEKAKSNLKGVAHPADATNDSIDLLIAQSLILEEIIEESLLELCKFKELKSSAFLLRKKFNGEHCSKKSILTKIALIKN